MNVAKLFSIIEIVKSDFDKYSILESFQELVGHVQNQINQPNQPTHQQNLATVLNTLRQNLGQCSTNDLSPAWISSLIELDFYEYLGNELLAKIDEIFARNQITLAIALEELQGILNKLNEIRSHINNIHQGLAGLNISRDELDENECEVGIQIPREAIRNNLEEFSRELRVVSLIFNTFAEVVEGKHTEIELRTLSTTDPLLTFLLPVKIATLISIVVARILAEYKKLLEIKKLKLEIEKLEVPAENLQGIEDHANTIIGNAVKDAIKEHYNEYCAITDKNKKKQFKNQLEKVTNMIANRIDKGYTVEVRFNEPEETEDAENEANEDNANYEKLIIASSELKYFPQTTKPLLSLPEDIEIK